MIFSKKRQGPLIANTCDRPILRHILFMLLVGLIISAYWWNFDYKMRKLQPANNIHPVEDVQKIIPKEELYKLYAWREGFQKHLGIPVFLKVTQGLLEVPSFETTTLFIGMGLDAKEVVVILPPIAKKIIGEGNRLLLEENLRQCIRNNNQDNQGDKDNKDNQINQNTSVGTCLDQGLKILWEQFQ